MKQAIQIFILLSCLQLQACYIPVPKPDYKNSQLGDSEIGQFIEKEYAKTKVYKNLFAEKLQSDLQNIIANKLPKNYSQANLKKVVSDMGMVCDDSSINCQYQGYIVSKANSFGKTIAGGKAIFSIYIDCQLGISSLKVIHNIVPLAD